MEYNFSKHSVGCKSRFLDTVNEQIVDVDINLPDYCPDIEKILKCTLIPKVYTRTISGGQLTIDGVSSVRILYCDSLRHNIRSFIQSVPFTATFNLKSTPEQYIVLSDTKCEYLNCRALSPRKLVVHGAFSLYAKVLCRDYNDFYSFEDECDLQIKCSSITASDLCAVCQEQFSVTEDITITSKPPVEALLTYDVSAYITDLKSINNKLMLNAELSLKVMYLSDLDSGKVEHISYVFPISRIIDCDGVMDDTVNVPYLEVMSYDLQIRNDSMNDGSLLSLDVKLCFSEMGYTSKDLNIIDDVYSVNYLTEPRRTALNYETNHSCENLTHIVKSTVSLDSMKISKVLDIYSDGVSLTPVVSDSALSMTGKTNLCILIEDGDGAPSYVERSAEIDYKPDIARGFDRAELNFANVQSISYRLVDDNTIEVRLELRICVLLCDAVSTNPVTFVECNEEDVIERDDCSLILYFAQKGENTWDIAKHYRTKEGLLIEENSLNESVIDSSRMLLVPTE